MTVSVLTRGTHVFRPASREAPRLFVLVLALIAIPTTSAQAPSGDSLLYAALTENRHAVALTDGQLTGPGGELLLREGRASQFVMVGEHHGVAEIPEITSALFQALRPDGYNHLAIETGPHTATLLEAEAQAGGVEGLRAFARQYPFSIPFYHTLEDAQLLADAVTESDDAPTLWGLDQEFIGSPILWLMGLEERASSESARDLARQYREREEAAIAAQDMGAIFMMSAGSSDYDALRAAFSEDAEAVAQIDALEESAVIYRMLMVERRTYDSNARRARHMRQAFLENYRHARAASGMPPRAILRVGANHGYRGQNRFHVFDIGSLVANLSEADGTGSFHVYMIPGPGTEQAAFTPQGMRVVPVGDYSGSKMAPFVAASDESAWTLFDLRPLRAPLYHSQLGEIDPELREIVFGYDAVLVLSGSTPASFD